MCEACYCRKRRRDAGMPEAKRTGRVVTTGGYAKLRAVGHPLVDTHGYVMEHRMVLFRHLGADAVLSCFWCARALTWKTCVIDHLNERKQDNRVENLVVACNRCNRARGAMLPFIASLASNERLEMLMRLFVEYRKTANEDGDFGR